MLIITSYKVQRAVKSQNESQLMWGQQQEITIIRPEGRMLMVALSVCAKRAREKSVQPGGKEKDAVFMSLGQRKFSFVHRKPGIGWMHIGSNKVVASVCGGETCKTSSLPPLTVTGQPAHKVSLLLVCFLSLFRSSSLSLFPLAYS